ncbi:MULTISPECIES: cell division protein FtsQ/DivIB [Limnobacter]|uniref:Cell division protein FtsQ n=1 Tax=Limnobacter litoralis TaxID=481366 RepID=A0ABQ5YNC2_9BURK|nr:MULTISPECIES: cell division protein FtsQ/DivIB [Limnobacter]GLR26073.1 cell division protein FtsQ [Limnobacter litoralis]HEX5485779.1 cell division protein FtsQ/DivIB [Limnobacter sp.]
MLGAIWQDSKLMSIMAGFFSAMAFALLGYAGLQWLIHRPLFELQKVELTGEVDRINLVSFRANVLPEVQGSFFSVNLSDVREQVEDQPWVRKAVIQRMWPNGLRIRIQSQKPLAYWGDNLLINTYGEVFSANPAEVGDNVLQATLNGPPGSELLVAKMYVNASKVLRKLGLQLKDVNLSDRYGWSFKTESGLNIELGREQENFTINQKLDRLVAIYPKIKEQLMQTVDSIDLRYPRGVAVKGERLAGANAKPVALKTSLN